MGLEEDLMAALGQTRKTPTTANQNRRNLFKSMKRKTNNSSATPALKVITVDPPQPDHGANMAKLVFPVTTVSSPCMGLHEKLATNQASWKHPQSVGVEEQSKRQKASSLEDLADPVEISREIASRYLSDLDLSNYSDFQLSQMLFTHHLQGLKIAVDIFNRAQTRNAELDKLKEINQTVTRLVVENEDLNKKLKALEEKCDKEVENAREKAVAEFKASKEFQQIGPKVIEKFKGSDDFKEAAASLACSDLPRVLSRRLISEESCKQLFEELFETDLGNKYRVHALKHAFLKGQKNMQREIYEPLKEQIEDFDPVAFDLPAIIYEEAQAL